MVERDPTREREDEGKWWWKESHCRRKQRCAVNWVEKDSGEEREKKIFFSDLGHVSFSDWGFVCF